MQLTTLYYDLVESTRILDRSDLEDFQELIAAFQAMAGKAIGRHGGTLYQTIGDGGIAMFASNVDPRDAATAAIEAGLEIVEGCRRMAADTGRPDLHVRAGIATSMVVVEGGGQDLRAATVIGVAPAMATRLQAEAQPDSVLVSQQTRALARRSHVFQFLGERRLKGFSEPASVWRAIRRKLALDRFFAFARITTPLIGREAELQIALDSWRAAVAGQGGALLIEGEAGIGKSRLLHAIERAIKPQSTSALLFQCSPAGVHSTLQPLLHAIMNATADRSSPPRPSAVADAFARQGIADPEVIDVFSFLLGAGGHGPDALRELAPETIHQKAAWAARRCVELIGARGPFVLAIEDVHWIDATSRRLLEALIESAAGSRCLIVMTARPSAGSTWGELPAVTRIELPRLAPRETRLAVEAHWRDRRTPIPGEWSDLVYEATGGIPLFIEECCHWMGEHWDAPKALKSAVAAFPRSTFGSIISARLEAIGSAKEVAKCGAVIGQDFDLALICAILPDMPDDEVRESLSALVEAGILIRNRGPGMPSHSFRHALIQEAIYDALLRKARRTFHKRIFAAVAAKRDLAPWMGTAMLAAHAERAEMIEDAAECYTLAGRESSALSATIEARQLLDRAVELSERIGDAARKDVLTLSALSALGPVLITLEGSVSSRACTLYDRGVELARRRPIGERATWFPIFWGWWFTGADFSAQ
ncbi:MAG TPA: AAA family ATPase, partial [Sinorhizobium sp.]|nr:AAA family ATPase [Sinorhizobium sp.]